jgi:hypothetical protein
MPYASSSSIVLSSRCRFERVISVGVEFLSRRVGRTRTIPITCRGWVVHASKHTFAAPRVFESSHVHLYYYHHRNDLIFLTTGTFYPHGVQENPTDSNPTAAATRKADGSRSRSREDQRIHRKASAFSLLICASTAYRPNTRFSIHYSDRYTDDEYEYRHVILPKPLFKMIPKTYFNSDDPGVLRLLSEAEWRGIGITQSLGWEHYEVHGTLAIRPFCTYISDGHCPTCPHL